jgi:hypothetical protein
LLHALLPLNMVPPKIGVRHSAHPRCSRWVCHACAPAHRRRFHRRQRPACDRDVAQARTLGEWRAGDAANRSRLPLLFKRAAPVTSARRASCGQVAPARACLGTTITSLDLPIAVDALFGARVAHARNLPARACSGVTANSAALRSRHLP